MNQDEQEDKGCCSNQEIKVDKKIDYTIFNTFDLNSSIEQAIFAANDRAIELGKIIDTTK